MRINSLLVVLLGGVMVVRPAAQPETLYERNESGFSFKQVALNEPVTTAQLERLYKAQIHLSASISVIHVFRSRNAAFAFRSNKGLTENDYSSWLLQYLQAVKEPPTEMGEIIQVGQNVLVRTVQAGTYEEKILSGKDPLTCGSGSPDCRIIWISIGRIPPHQETFKQPMVSLFIRLQKAPTIPEASKIATAMQQTFRTKLLSVSFRSDEWFIDDLFFPVIYPFTRNRHPADLERIRTDDEVMCVSSGEEFHCGSNVIR